MQFDKELAALLQSGYVMNGEAQTLRQGADGFEKMFALRRARLRVHHYIGGHNFADTFFDGVAERMNLFEAGGTSHAHGGIDEMTIPGAAHAHAINIQDAFHAGYRASHLLTKAFGRGIHQSIKGAPAKSRSNPQNN